MEVCAEGAAGPNGLAGAVEVKGSAFLLPWWSEKSHQVSSGCWGPVPVLWPVVAAGLSPITSALRVGAQQGPGGPAPFLRLIPHSKTSPAGTWG